MHWFVYNDAERVIGGVNVGGSAFRAGRFVFRWGGHRARVKLEWSFWNRLSWIEGGLSLGGEDGEIAVHLILPWLASLHAGISLPQRWLDPWMIEDRVFSARVGYVGSLLDVQIAHAQWAEDCGMTDYYRQRCPGKYTALQLWPGIHFSLHPWPLDWIFGKMGATKLVIRTKDVSFEMDGRTVSGTWDLEQWTRRRPRWPFGGKSLSSWLEVPDPPQFAGKGENSWDCDDDGIHGMGSKETTPAAAVGEYIKSVLKNRERYGQPRRRAS